MNIENQREQLLLKLMHLLAKNFKNQAVLKGGMRLRLLNSPRQTQDADYVFSGQSSRREILTRLKKIIAGEANIKILNTEMNSRGLIIECSTGDATAFLEIATSQILDLPPESMTTSALASRYQMPAQVITIMSLAESYVHKIAACLERRALRDLYDLTILQPLTVLDHNVLKKRLSHLFIERKKPVAISVAEAARRLSLRGEDLQQKNLERELHGLVPDDFLTGGRGIIKNCLNKLCQELLNIS